MPRANGSPTLAPRRPSPLVRNPARGTDDALRGTAFFVIPLIVLAVYSVSKFDLLTFQVQSGFTLENYREIVQRHLRRCVSFAHS